MSQSLFPALKPLRFNYEHCPVCGLHCPQGFRDYISEGTLCESVEECPNGCYYYHFAYGNTELGITIREHHIVFYSNYHDTPQENRDRDATTDIIIAAAQACLLEDYWAKFPRLACFQCGKPSTVSFCGDRCARKGYSSPIVHSETGNVQPNDLSSH